MADLGARVSWVVDPDLDRRTVSARVLDAAVTESIDDLPLADGHIALATFSSRCGCRRMCARLGAAGYATAASSTSRAVLTDLQRRVRGIIAGLPEGAAVALAGGSALIVTGVVRRGTDDLDFFAAHPQPVAPMLDALETGLEEAGLRVTRLRAADTYARLLIESDSDATYVDLATDYRLMPALQTAEGLVLADRELAANKTLALFEESAGQSCEGWQYTFDIRGQVSRTFNTTGPDRNGSRTKNGNDEAPSGLRATTKSSTQNTNHAPNPRAGHRPRRKRTSGSS